MKKIPISISEAGRNFSDCVRRVHDQNIAYVLIKNGTPFAQLVPVREKICYGRDLLKVLERVELPVKEAKAWHRDLKKARKVLKAPRPLTGATSHQ